MARIRSAGTAEIIRSHQKDDGIIHHLRSLVTDIAQATIGPHLWIHWRHRLDVIADIGYFILTTFSDLQTVGEEYVNIIQTDHTLRRIPTKVRRALMIALQVCAPYLLQSALNKFEHLLQNSTRLPIRPANRKYFLDLIPVIRRSVYIIHRVHLAFFYLRGIFYHPAKRIAGIRYMQISSGEGGSHPNKSFQILGYLSLLQIFISFALYVYYVAVTIKERQSLTNLVDQSLESGDQLIAATNPKEKCPLCLGKRQNSSLTPCGHLFCWNCILEWCQSKPECPLCRDQFAPQQLILLQNYDSS